MDDLAEAMNRVADTLSQLAAGQQEVVREVRETRGVCQRILDAITEPDEQSPVADALEAITATVERLETTQAALMPGVHEVVTFIRSRTNRNGG